MNAGAAVTASTTVALLAIAAVLVTGAWIRAAVLGLGRRPVATTTRSTIPRLVTARRRRRKVPDDADVAAWCRRVGAGVRAGGSLTSAVIEADAATDPDRRPFPDVVHAVRRGRPLAGAFRAVVTDPASAAGLAAPVLATCAELGGPTSSAIERVAEVLLARNAERAERRAASAQARLSARVLTLVPLCVAAFLALTEPSIRAALASPAGLACLGTGAALDLAGWWWMRALIGGGM